MPGGADVGQPRVFGADHAAADFAGPQTPMHVCLKLKSLAFLGQQVLFSEDAGERCSCQEGLRSMAERPCAPASGRIRSDASVLSDVWSIWRPGCQR